MTGAMAVRATDRTRLQDTTMVLAAACVVLFIASIFVLPTTASAATLSGSSTAAPSGPYANSWSRHPHGVAPSANSWSRHPHGVAPSANSWSRHPAPSANSWSRHPHGVAPSANSWSRHPHGVAPSANSWSRHPRP